MKKIILLIFCCMFLTGCQLDYKLDLKDDKISESITGVFEYDIYEYSNLIDSDGFYIESELVNEEIPAFVDYSDFYKKEIKVEDGISTAILSYEYNYDNFENSYLISECFKNSVIYNEEDYYYIKLSGDFSCYSYEDIQIKISTDKKVISENSDEYKDGYYIWNVNKEDNEQDISFQISKTEKADEVVKKSKINIFPIMGILLLGGAIIIFLLFKKKMKNDE